MRRPTGAPATFQADGIERNRCAAPLPSRQPIFSEAGRKAERLGS